ncbi:ribonuclease H-like domain-containing protein, partial [Tanacetum coccineum]
RFEIVGFPQGFKRNSNTGKQTFNANVDIKMNGKSSSTLSSGFTPEQMQKLLSKSNVVLSFHVSKLLWHNILGHPTDQDLSVLKNDLSIFYNTYVPMCEVCQRAKQTKELFPLSDHKSKTLDELVHLDLKPATDVENTNEVNHLQFFDGQFPQSPNDDGKDSSVEDGSLPHYDNFDSTQGRYQSGRHSATHTSVLRRSDRQSKLPVRLNDYVLNSNVKYGIEKYVEAMNNEIEALNTNNTWTICDLPIGRKPIGNVNNAFLYGDLVEDVNMTLPDGYNDENKFKHGFEQSKFDYSVYTKHSNDKFIALLMYVDDNVITRNDDFGIKEFKLFLSAKFLIKDLGVLKYFLGIEVVENDLGLCMSQRKYCLELLHLYGLLAARPVDIPLPENFVLILKKPKMISISHMHSPLQSHFKSALESFKAKCPKTRRSVTGFCVFLGKTLVSWKSKKQDTVSKSSSEAEYRSMSFASCEVVWLGNLLHSIGIKNLFPVELYYDNSSAIQIAANPVFHERTKHFELDVHFAIDLGYYRGHKCHNVKVVSCENVFLAGYDKIWSQGAFRSAHVVREKLIDFLVMLS